ncbi:MAG: dihydrolipoyl dehydrogenase, partial [Flexibacter sp. CG_4_10_14_3_um_filter_32_15]
MKYDVTIIGSGPGGYVAAIRAAQLGLKTAIIEKYATLGGTCLNVGCIPSKALLDSSEHFHAAQKDFKEHGIDINAPKVNFEQMVERKRGVVQKTCDGIAFLMKKNKIDVHQGVGSFIDKNNIKVIATDSKEKGKETKIETDKVIIATGSKPTIFPFFPYDKKRFITSTEALELKEVPKKMIIIGGGVIGMELGSVYARLGTEVSVIEFMP